MPRIWISVLFDVRVRRWGQGRPPATISAPSLSICPYVVSTSSLQPCGLSHPVNRPRFPHPTGTIRNIASCAAPDTLRHLQNSHAFRGDTLEIHMPRIAVTIEARAHDRMIVVVGTFIEISLLILGHCKCLAISMMCHSTPLIASAPDYLGSGLGAA
jgi:hypothetical protein